MIEVSVEALERAVARVTARFVDKNSPDVSLQCLRLRFEEKTLEVSGTDIEAFAICAVPIQSDQREIPRSILVDAGVFSQLISRLYSDDVEKISLTVGEVLVIKCKGKSFRLETKAAEAFPNFLKTWEERNSNPHTIQFSYQDFTSAVDRVSYIQGGMEREAKLNAVALEIKKDTIDFINTDGRRIGISHHPCINVDGVKSMILINRKTLSKVQSALDRAKASQMVSLCFDDSMAVFSLEDEPLRIGVRTLAITFADHSKFLNLDILNNFQVERQMLLDGALRMADLFRDQKYGAGIKIEVSTNGLHLETYLPRGNEGSEDLPLKNGPNEPLVLFCDAHLLIQGLQAMTSENVLIEKEISGLVIRVRPVDPEEKFVYMLAQLKH